MVNIPYWIIFSLQKEKIICNECGRIFIPNDIKAIGIRDSYRNKDKETIFVELICIKCRSMTLYEIKNMKLIDFAIDILKQQNDIHDLGQQNNINDLEQQNDIHNQLMRKSSDPNFCPNTGHCYNLKKTGSSHRSKSKITLKELKEHAKFLDSIKTHEEFLIALGMSPEEIEKYQYKKKKKK